MLLLFPPTQGPNAKPVSEPYRYDFSGQVVAEQIHAWITRQLPPRDYPPLQRPVNVVRVIVIVTLIVGLFTFGTVAYPYLLPVIQNRNLWAGVSLIAILLFTSGHMFNHIRHVPYVSGDGHGGIQYFAGGFSNQFGMETQIVAAMYALLAFSTIALALKVPRIKESQDSTHGDHHMGKCHFWHVQLPDERFSGEESRLSFLAASLLKSCHSSVKNVGMTRR